MRYSELQALVKAIGEESLVDSSTDVVFVLYDGDGSKHVSDVKKGTFPQVIVPIKMTSANPSAPQVIIPLHRAVLYGEI